MLIAEIAVAILIGIKLIALCYLMKVHKRHLEQLKEFNKAV
jgi:hypothetical protein